MSTDDFEYDNLTEEQINQILESDDPEAIARLDPDAVEAATEKTTEAPESKADEEPEPEPKAEEDPADSATTDDKDGAAASGTDEKQAEEAKAEEDPESKPASILSKDGKHHIPYSVLESARAREKALKDELTELREKVSQTEGTSQRMAKALEAHGVDLKAMEEGETLSEDVLKSIADADPDIARAIGFLQQRLEAATTQIETLQSQPKVDPVEMAIRENTDLKTWRKNDRDRWEKAVDMDDALKIHPEWKNKSIDERFNEAVRLTKLEFGDPLTPKPDPSPNPKPAGKSAEQLAAERVAAASQRQAPASLTDMGQSPSTEKSLVERFAEMSDAQVQEAMDSMSEDQLAQLSMDAIGS